MPRLKLDAGAKLVGSDEAELVIIEARARGQLLVEEVLCGRRRLLTRAEVEKKLLSGKLKLLLSVDEAADDRSMPLDMLSPKIRAGLERRKAYVQALDKFSQQGAVYPYIAEVIETVAGELDDRRPPSTATLYRWFRVWIKGGRHAASLLPKGAVFTLSKPDIGKEELRIILEEIDKRYLTTERATLKSALPHIRVRIRNENLGRESNDQLRVPSDATIYRIKDTLDPYTVVMRREGKAVADHMYRHVGKGLSVEAPLDVVEIDHTILDIQVLAPVPGYVARPTLTVAIDKFSRMPIGVYLGFASPGYEALMLCLRNAILPKDALLRLCSLVEQDWPCYGLPRLVVVDNGMEFHSGSFLDACASLNISCQFHPVRQPHYKGMVEEFFSTVNQRFLTGLRGKTFSNTQEKGDNNPVSEAVIPFDVFEQAFFKWLVDGYLREFHRGVEAFPVEVWEEGVSKFPVDVPQNYHDLLILLNETHYRTITRKGVEIFSAYYNSTELSHLFGRLGKPQKIRLKVDPLNIGAVYVFDEQRNSFITVPCLREGYDGLSLWQYRMIRQALLAKKKLGEERYNVDEVYVQITEMIDRYSRKKKNVSNKRAARFLTSGGTDTYQVCQAERELEDKKPVEASEDANSLLADAKEIGWGKSQGENK